MKFCKKVRTEIGEGGTQIQHGGVFTGLHVIEKHTIRLIVKIKPLKSVEILAKKPLGHPILTFFGPTSPKP